MKQSLSREALLKVQKLAQLANDLRAGQSAEVTRLTSLKGLCQDASVANQFVTYLARKSLERIDKGQGRSQQPTPEKTAAHRQLMVEAVAELESASPLTEERRERLWELWRQMQAEQNEHKRVKSTVVRLITDNDLLLFEYAVTCVLHPNEAGSWAYQTARHYAERLQPEFCVRSGPEIGGAGAGHRRFLGEPRRPGRGGAGWEEVEGAEQVGAAERPEPGPEKGRVHAPPGAVPGVHPPVSQASPPGASRDGHCEVLPTDAAIGASHDREVARAWAAPPGAGRGPVAARRGGGG